MGSCGEGRQTNRAPAAAVPETDVANRHADTGTTQANTHTILITRRLSSVFHRQTHRMTGSQEYLNTHTDWCDNREAGSM